MLDTPYLSLAPDSSRQYSTGKTDSNPYVLLAHLPQRTEFFYAWLCTLHQSASTNSIDQELYENKLRTCSARIFKNIHSYLQLSGRDASKVLILSSQGLLLRFQEFQCLKL